MEVGPLQGHARVIAQNKILVAQYLVGQEASAVGALAGDPSLTTLVAIEQCVPIAKDEFKIAVTYAVGAEEPRLAARLAVEPGMHRLVGNLPVGLNVYGYGEYTSYAYPGGLELAPIVITPR